MTYKITPKDIITPKWCLLKAVNPKTNCFVCMDMKLSNWDLSYNNLYMHKSNIFMKTPKSKIYSIHFSLHKMFSYISLPHQVFPLSKLQNH